MLTGKNKQIRIINNKNNTVKSKSTTGLQCSPYNMKCNSNKNKEIKHEVRLTK